MAGWQRPRPVPPAGVCRLRTGQSAWQRWRWPVLLSLALHLAWLVNDGDRSIWGSGGDAGATRMPLVLAAAWKFPPADVKSRSPAVVDRPSAPRVGAVAANSAPAASSEELAPALPAVGEGDASAEFRLELARLSRELLSAGYPAAPPLPGAWVELEIAFVGAGLPEIRQVGASSGATFAAWGDALTRLALSRATVPSQWQGRRLRYRLEADAE